MQNMNEKYAFCLHHHVTFHNIRSHNISLHHIESPYSTLHVITLHHLKSHYIRHKAVIGWSLLGEKTILHKLVFSSDNLSKSRTTNSKEKCHQWSLFSQMDINVAMNAYFLPSSFSERNLALTRWDGAQTTHWWKWKSSSGKELCWQRLCVPLHHSVK